MFFFLSFLLSSLRWQQIPSKALNARSLSGSLFNLGVGLALALSAVVVAFRAVPAAQLGPARPEAAWAFFWARSTSLVVLFYGEFRDRILQERLLIVDFSGKFFLLSLSSTTSNRWLCNALRR